MEPKSVTDIAAASPLSLTELTPVREHREPEPWMCESGLEPDRDAAGCWRRRRMLPEEDAAGCRMLGFSTPTQADSEWEHRSGDGGALTSERAESGVEQPEQPEEPRRAASRAQTLRRPHGRRLTAE
ncbi:unnamed protein product [Pleuronectes platessa]|uniref:Uncharacterized protein n=1 Tax=Pleuronectes platessa TaxID=8262 RepID=A0A9N7ZAU5_PLEPL|nr:unnamed protein product [Pleuronectes platessa]